MESTPVSGFDLTLSLDLSEYKEIKSTTLLLFKIMNSISTLFLNL